MKIKTYELTGAALDWAVAKCEGFIKVAIWPDHIGVCKKHSFENQLRWKPSTDWAQGGPIIEREGIQINFWRYDRPPYWTAHISREDGRFADYHSAPLIAAMRCYVASKLGDEIELPKELT